MSIDLIRKFTDARPFVPFTIITSDGWEYPVEHPDFVSTGEGSSVVIVHDRKGDFNVLNVVQINNVKVLATQGQHP